MFNHGAQLGLFANQINIFESPARNRGSSNFSTLHVPSNYAVLRATKRWLSTTAVSFCGARLKISLPSLVEQQLADNAQFLTKNGLNIDMRINRHIKKVTSVFFIPVNMERCGVTTSSCVLSLCWPDAELDTMRSKNPYTPIHRWDELVPNIWALQTGSTLKFRGTWKSRGRLHNGAVRPFKKSSKSPVSY